MPYWVYILRNKFSGTLYTGQTANLEKRLESHNNKQFGRQKYTTKLDGSWQLIHSEETKTRSEAMRRERFLKSGQGRKWITVTLLKKLSR